MKYGFLFFYTIHNMQVRYSYISEKFVYINFVQFYTFYARIKDLFANPTKSNTKYLQMYVPISVAKPVGKNRKIFFAKIGNKNMWLKSEKYRKFFFDINFYRI